MYIAVRMTPVCALTVNTDCGVKIVPLIGGIPPTSSIYHIDIFYSYNNILIFLSLLLITFRYQSLEGYVKEAASQSLLLIYIYCT
jgi:hypothetical protein